MFELGRKTIERKYKGKTVKAEIREISGYESDQCVDNAREIVEDDEGNKTINVSMAETGRRRVMLGVEKLTYDGEEIDIEANVKVIPASIYKWLSDEINSFNDLTDLQEKN